MDTREFIKIADGALNRHLANDKRAIGDTAAALIGANGKVYTGVNVDTPSWGLCAERSAMATMITDGEYVVKKVVAVWRDDSGNNLTILPPCGVCREFMRQVDYDNMNAEVVLGINEIVSLAELIPAARWPRPLSD